MKRAFIHWGAAAFASASFLSPTNARAGELAYQTTAGAGHSDNIARTAENEIDEDIASAGLRFSLYQFSSRLEADLLGDFAYYDYLDDTFDSELLGNFAGAARLRVVPERLEWMIADNFGQVLNDPFQPSTPETRENVNYLTTGPDLMFSFGSQTRLRLGARYSRTSYEDSPFDSDGALGEIELARLLSSASSLSLNVRSQQVEYDERALNADYELGEAFVRYYLTGARTHLSLDVGYTQIDREAAEAPESGLLLRLDASRRISAASTMDLTLGREFSSSAAAFASTQSGAGVNLSAAPGRQTVDPFTNDYATLGWNFSRHRTGLSLYASWNEQSHEDQPLLDQALSSLTAGVERQFSQAASLFLDTGFSNADFQDTGRDYTEVQTGLTFSWRLSRSLFFNLAYDYIDRNSDLTLGDYTENRYWLSVGYGRGEPRSTAMRPAFGVDAADPGT